MEGAADHKRQVDDKPPYAAVDDTMTTTTKKMVEEQLSDDAGGGGELPEQNYRGWKAMPYVIGECVSFAKALFIRCMYVVEPNSYIQLARYNTTANSLTISCF